MVLRVSIPDHGKRVDDEGFVFIRRQIRTINFKNTENWMFWMRDFSVKLFARKFTSICPLLMRVHENFSRLDFAPVTSAISQGATPVGGGLVSLVLWQGLAMSRGRPWGCRVERPGFPVLDTADPSWLPWTPGQAGCPMMLLLISFCGRISCKDQGVELQDLYGSFST